jgi:hypothetical protein
MPIANNSASNTVVLLATISGRRGQHDGDLDPLDDADEAGLVAGVGERAGAGGPQKERQDEEAGGERDQQPGGQCPAIVGPVGDHQDQRVLHRVVVEGRQELRGEQRPEAARAEQRARAVPGTRRGPGSVMGLRHGRRPRAWSRRNAFIANPCDACAKRSSLVHRASQR